MEEASVMLTTGVFKAQCWILAEANSQRMQNNNKKAGRRHDALCVALRLTLFMVFYCFGFGQRKPQ